MIAATVVDWGALGQVIVYSLVAGIGIPAIFALAVMSASRMTDPHRERGGAAVAAYGLLALVGTAVCLVAVAYGLYLMTQ
jgi:hypothetical protein